jgi:hypothetical protein
MNLQTKRLEETAAISQSALEDERDKRRNAARELDDLRKAHRKHDSEAAMWEIRVAENHLLIESKDEQIRKCEEEVRHLVRFITILCGHVVHSSLTDWFSLRSLN